MRSAALHIFVAASLLVIGMLGVTKAMPTRGALAAMATTDLLLAGQRGTADEVIRFAETHGSGRIADVRGYVQEVYRLGPQVGLDPAIVIAQSAHETGYWTSAYWRFNLNPAGIGIYADGVASYTWRSGVDAARYHLVLLYVYAAGPPPAGHPLYPYRTLGPGYDGAIQLGYAGVARTIRDLTGRWAVDTLYAEKLVAKGNEIYSRGLDVTGPSPSQPQTDVSATASVTSANPARAIDGDLTTSWAALSETPLRSAYMTFDLGELRQLTGVQWYFRSSNYADKWRVRVSADGQAWNTIAFLRAPPAKTWQGLNCAVTARYVRIQFDNPNNELALGYLAEVSFTSNRVPNPPTPTPAPTPTVTYPSESAALSGERLVLVGSGGSLGATYTGRVRDSTLSTDWHTTQTSPPASGYVYVDLGAPTTISGLRWVFYKAGHADSFTIQVSDDKRSWSAIGEGGNAPAGVWQSRAIEATGRYVRFLFANPNGDASIGYLAELEVWGEEGVQSAEASSPTVEASTTPSATVEATATEGDPTAQPTETPVHDPTATVEPPAPTATAEIPKESPTAVVETPTEAPIPTVAPTETTADDPPPPDEQLIEDSGVEGG